MTRLLLTLVASTLTGAANPASAADPAYVGRWASDRAVCAREPRKTEGEEVATRISRSSMSGNEETCTFKRVTQIRDRDGADQIWAVDALCVTEGVVSRGRFTLRVDPSGTLRQEFPDNAKEPRQTPLPITLVRCP